MANATSKVRALKGLSLKESVSQFSSTMTAQADLRVECAHLRRFYNNFASVSQSVTPPYPFPGCETAEVLIETFEPGVCACCIRLHHCWPSIHLTLSCTTSYTHHPRPPSPSLFLFSIFPTPLSTTSLNAQTVSWAQQRVRLNTSSAGRCIVISYSILNIVFTFIMLVMIIHLYRSHVLLLSS